MPKQKKKVNPRRQPATQADVDHAREAGRVEGTQFALTCIVWLLCDKHDAPIDDVKQFSGEFQYLNENISAGNVRFSEVKRALKEEYDWEVSFYVGDNTEGR